MKKILLAFYFFFLTIGMLDSQEASLEGLPVAYQGRFREYTAYSELWLKDFYHSLTLKKEDQLKLGIPSTKELLLKIHFSGHDFLDNFPFFALHSKELKQLINLEIKKSRFSYATLSSALKKTEFLKNLATLVYKKKYYTTPNKLKYFHIELKEIEPGLWLSSKDGKIEVLEKPKNASWSHIENLTPIGDLHPLSQAETLALNEFDQLKFLLQQYENLQGTHLPFENNLTSAIANWKKQGLSSSDIHVLMDDQFPLRKRLQLAGSTLKMLPGKIHKGEWYSLHALQLKSYKELSKIPEYIDNFTLFTDGHFEKLRHAYFNLMAAFLSGKNAEIKEWESELGKILYESYHSLAGTAVNIEENNKLFYPTLNQLKAEKIYYTFPLIELSLALYFIALCSFVLALQLKGPKLEFLAIITLIIAFTIHTIVIGLRCYILNRPPVSNMFETVIYVPWVSVLLSFIIKPFLNSSLLYVASSTIALLLLVILKISNMNSGMENVQAVLDSQYWLIIHVMMIVGSYGVFALSGILSHLYLAGIVILKNESSWLKYTASCILQTLYIGLALLIPGTILGGIWAAQSWGRFWDWDPKESWAFISSCIYLIWVHAYRFGYVKNFGLAIGSICGLISISFTWYGVNYILGTGLHSYGFGTAENKYYYLYLLIECFFLLCVSSLNKIFLPRKGNVGY